MRGVWCAVCRGCCCVSLYIFNGTVYAKSGEFDGIIKARDICLLNGDTMTSIINNKGKIDADWLDLYGINVKNKAGNTVLTINENGLRFGSGYSPIVYQFSTSLSGPWHDTMGTNDKYRRDSLDGGTTWGTPYQFVGTDGRNGSDANVTFNNILSALQKAENTKTSFITADGVGAPTIYGAKIYGAEIYAGGIDEKGGQVIGLTDGGMKIYDGHGNDVLTIRRSDYGGAYISAKDGYIDFSTSYINLLNFNTVTFSGMTVDFSEVKEIKGVYATFA